MYKRAGALYLTILAVAVPSSAQRFEATRPLMGTEFRIVVISAGGEASAPSAIVAAFARVAELESVFSDYDPASEISVLAEQGGGVPSRELRHLIEESRAWHARTGGAFDITLGQVTRVWRHAMRRQVLPDSARLAAAHQASGWENVRLSADSLVLRGGVRLDFGAIAKGYAADQALRSLEADGFEMALVDAGGDLRFGEAPPGSWLVEFPDGSKRTLQDGAVATSGGTHRHLQTEDGARLSHILDPRTGRGLAGGRTVTVHAPTAMEADVLATALSVMPIAEGRALIQSLGYTAYIERAHLPTVVVKPTQ